MRRPPLLLALLIFSAVVENTLAQTMENETASDTEQIDASERFTAMTNMAQLSSTSRFVYFSNPEGRSLAEITPEFCAPDPLTSDCRWEMYIESIVLISAIPFIMAAFAIVGGIIFWAMRACGFCGGLRPSYGYCCSLASTKRDTLEDAYSKRSVFITRFGLVAISILLIVSFSITQAGSSAMHDAIVQFTDRTLDDGETLYDTVNNITREMSELFSELEDESSVPSDLDDVLAGALQEGEGLLDQVEEYATTILDYDAQRLAVVNAFLIFSMVIVISSAAGALLMVPSLAYFVATLGFLTFALSMVGFGVHYTVGVLIADVCYELDAPPGTSNLAVRAYVDCSGFPFLAEVGEIIEGGVNATRETFCDVYSGDLCNAAFPCPYDETKSCGAVHCENVTRAECLESDPATLIDMMIIEDVLVGCGYNDGPTPGLVCDASEFPPRPSTSIPCPAFANESDVSVCLCNSASGRVAVCDTVNKTVEQCAGVDAVVTSHSPTNFTIELKPCFSTTLRNAASDLLHATDLIADFATLKDESVDPLVNCTLVGNYLTAVADFVCVRALNSFTTIAVGCALGGALFAFAIYFAVRGTKRFTKKFRAALRELRQLAMGRFLNIFDAMDTDRSGDLDRGEIMEIYRELWPNKPEGELTVLVEDLFDRLDTNNDGVITEIEFKAAVERREEVVDILTRRIERKRGEEALHGGSAYGASRGISLREIDSRRYSGRYTGEDV
mmetsp:Transcript_10084/g.31977  ORF Transcript_10084/g.31977 Transcript_10084/m.31977 type:complete len:730 (-) Transcript_10084:1879-4068(-)